MLRSRRLFWKLFAAFTIATAASFVIGVTYMRLTMPSGGSAAPGVNSLVRVASTLEHDGLDEAVAILRSDGSFARVAISDANDRWIAGARNIPASVQPMLIEAADGRPYHLRIQAFEMVEPGRWAPMVVGILVSLIVSAVVAWYLSRPLVHLSQGFRQLGRGELGIRLEPLVGGRRDEIADLTREFDRMAAQLQELRETQVRLFHDISHELRSPLARLEVAIGLLRQSPDNLPAMLDRVQRESGRLDHLIGELLTLARLKAGSEKLDAGPIDLIDILTAIVDDAKFEAAGKGCEVRYEPAGTFVTAAEGETLYRAFENVIRNAIKYSPPGGNIEVSVRIDEDCAQVIVRDQGGGVPAELTEAIFEPFNRGNRPEDDSVPGFGLGLAIAKFAIERHQGTIEARTASPGAGMQIVLRIPRTDPYNRLSK